MKLMFAARLPALTALLALLCTSVFASAAPPDFTTSEGYARACAATPAKATPVSYTHLTLPTKA